MLHLRYQDAILFWYRFYMTIFPDLSQIIFL